VLKVSKTSVNQTITHFYIVTKIELDCAVFYVSTNTV